MSNILQSAFLKAAEENSGSGSHCVSGCMYQVVQTIGTDGKNLLQLLPVSKSSGNLTPVVQSPVVSDDLKGNTGKPDQVTFQTQISSSSASAPVQLHIFQPANDTKYFHTRTVDTPGKGRVTSVGTGSLTPPVSNVESLVKTDGLTMQRFAIPPSTQNYSSYFVVNTPSLPVNMNSSVSPSGHPLQIPVNMNSSILPSGYRLQIPAYAEVKTTPATTLSPLVHQTIRGTATTSTSGTVEASQIPSVFDVSPVNSVQNRVTENLQNIYPKQVTINTSKIPLNDATQTQLKVGQHSQGTQVKWNFQENLQPGIPSRFPVTLSNNMASKILNTVIGRKIMGDNIKSTPLLSTVSSQRTHYIYVPVKHALVMLNGKVYLMTKKRLLSQYDQQNSVSSDIPLRKDCSQVVSSSPDTEIPKEVNSPLIKSKSLQLETKSLSNSQLASMASLTAEKDEKVERPSFSVTDSHTVNQSHNCLKQSQTVFTNPVFPDGFRTEQNAPREGNLIQGIEKICSSVDAATVTSQQCVFRDQESQTQYAMASMLKKETQEGNNKYSQGSNTKTSYLKSDDEFKKLFGLTKDLRVCLTRIPDHLCSRKGFDSFTNMVKNNSYRDADIVMKEEVKQHSFPKKRKAKTIKKTDYTKRRKIKRASDAVMNGTDEASSQLLSILPTPDLPQHNIVTSTASEDKRTELENCSHEKQEKDALSSSTSCEQSSYFNRSYTEDIFIVTPPELEETIRDEKIRRLKQNLREKEAALEEMRKKMHQKQ